MKKIIILSLSILLTLSHAAIAQKVKIKYFTDTYRASGINENKYAIPERNLEIDYCENALVFLWVDTRYENAFFQLIPAKRKEIYDALSKIESIKKEYSKSKSSQKNLIKSSTQKLYVKSLNEADIAPSAKYEIYAVPTEKTDGTIDVGIQIAIPAFEQKVKTGWMNFDRTTIDLTEKQALDLREKLSDKTVTTITTELKNGKLQPSETEGRLDWVK